ncbi:MAG: GntR family transcriptional regulator, partial [Synergistaceae bacterium]|nr:GntR family transcriptional regulator [Synergistaceae bacterium]
MKKDTQEIPEILQMAHRITDVTREKILNGEIEEGQRLTESYLADMFGVSRSPIREALRMLTHEGFIELLPYRGARVSVIRLKDVKEHYQLKAMLDGYVCYAVAQTITDEDLVNLANNIE